MTSRDERLAEKYRAKGKASASETARAKERGRRGRSSGGDSPASSSIMDAMRKAVQAPRDAESKKRGRAHKDGLPPLG